MHGADHLTQRSILQEGVSREQRKKTVSTAQMVKKSHVFKKNFLAQSHQYTQQQNTQHTMIITDCARPRSLTA
jgi:hypothetical protein